MISQDDLTIMVLTWNTRTGTLQVQLRPPELEEGDPGEAGNLGSGAVQQVGGGRV